MWGIIQDDLSHKHVLNCSSCRDSNQKHCQALKKKIIYWPKYVCKTSWTEQFYSFANVFKLLFLQFYSKLKCLARLIYFSFLPMSDKHVKIAKHWSVHMEEYIWKKNQQLINELQELCVQLQALLVKHSLLEEMPMVDLVNSHLSTKKLSTTNVFH